MQHVVKKNQSIAGGSFNLIYGIPSNHNLKRVCDMIPQIGIHDRMFEKVSPP